MTTTRRRSSLLRDYRLDHQNDVSPDCSFVIPELPDERVDVECMEADLEDSQELIDAQMKVMWKKKIVCVRASVRLRTCYL